MSEADPVNVINEAARPWQNGHMTKPIKCVIWDLDNTLWSGIIAEGDQIAVREEAIRAIRELDQRGILQSIASRNTPAQILPILEKAGLIDYFLYPQIDWAQKSNSVARIAESLNIGLDAVAFLDDEPFERDEVRFVHPMVECFDSRDLSQILQHPRVKTGPVTEEARNRRLLYQAEMQRRIEEQRFSDRTQDFLASLGMVFDIVRATEADLDRAAELVSRTNQLNTTGIVYSRAELQGFLWHPDYLLYSARLQDKYGSYGTIGFALVELNHANIVIKLLLMSCRVMSRGVGTVFLLYLMNLAKTRGLGVQAEFVPSERNRIMEITLRFAGFEEDHRRGDVIVLKHDLKSVAQYPAYIQVRSS